MTRTHETGAAVLAWHWKRLTDLTGGEVYDLLVLRQAVFILEQQCLYQDADGLDRDAWHLLGRDLENRLVAYLRVLAPAARFAEPSIGRVVTHPEMRGTGLGRTLMAEGLRRTQHLYPGSPIRISAQAHLATFYESFGFSAAGEIYLEDGIPHVDMVRASAGP